MIGDRSLQHVDGPRSALVIVHRAKDSSRLHGHLAKPKSVPFHALDLRTEVNRGQ